MKKKLGPEEIKDEMLALLEQKYGEEFVPVNLTLANWAYSYDQLKAYPKNGSREDAFAVKGTREEDGSYSVADGYFGIIIRDKYEANLKNLVGDVYKEFKLYTTFSEDNVYPARLNKDTELNDIYRENEHFVTQTKILVKKSEVDDIGYLESILKIAEKMRDQKLVSSVLLYEVYDEKYDEVSLETLKLDPFTFDEYFANFGKMPFGVSSNLEILTGEE